MFQRTARRSLSRVSRTAESCHRCTCRCGASFQAASFSSSATRLHPVKAPITRSRERLQRGQPLEAVEAKKQVEFDDLVVHQRRATFREAQADGHVSIGPDAVDKFLNRFVVLCSQSRLRRTGGIDPEKFKELQAEFRVSDKEALYIALVSLQDKWHKASREYGQRLLFSLSAAGYDEAVIRIINHALLQSKDSSTVLRSSQVATARGHLHKIVRAGTNYRATVLEGKVAYKLGDEDNAIKLWWQAMEACRKLGDQQKAEREAGQSAQRQVVKDLFELSSPWVELIEAHYDRSATKGKDEWQQLEEAIAVGIEQDDPTAFYYAATYYKDRDPDGTHLPTSRWLWYMTKAAVSGVPKACHELGVFYAESGWKYIEDEPPDHVKPTPFDSYPSPDKPEGGPSTLQHLQAFFRPAPPALSEQDTLFHSAAFPSTPEQRLHLAKHWLDVAISYTYAPSYLYLAKLHLQPTLWAGAAAPAKALNLSQERYTYDTAEERHDAEFTGQAKSWSPPPDAIDPPNPIHSESAAQACLAEVFHAHIAVRSRAVTLAAAVKRRSRSNDIAGQTGTPLSDEDFATARWDLASRNAMTQHQDMIKFFENMDVFHMWEAESAGLVEEAAGIAEERGWDLWDSSGGLLYRRGAGMVQKNVTPFIFQ